MNRLSPLLFTLCILIFATTSFGCGTSDKQPNTDTTDVNIQIDTGLLLDTDETQDDVEQQDDADEQTDIEEQTDADEQDDVEEQTDADEQDDVEEQTDVEEPAEFTCPTGHHAVNDITACTNAGNINDLERGCITFEDRSPTFYCAADQTTNCSRADVATCPTGYASVEKAACESSEQPCGFYMLCDFISWCVKN